MRNSKWICFESCFKTLALLAIFVGLATPAFADLEGSMASLMDAIRSLSTPVAIILLIFAGWQRMLGNSQIFYAALIGAVIVFAAPMIVELISSVF
ncbi:MAG TPA: TrbC/VirB2 family protein [Candidatus Omnitrophota bacterium]|nr:TrbC/VirB2 family protein [Candidatus Omnitrophota bacterium]